MDNDGSKRSGRAGVDGCFADFEAWFHEVVYDVRPSSVISVARGAVRFLQLNTGPDCLGKVRHLSHYSIPFMREEELSGKRFLIFDDSVIFGSTLDTVKTELEDRGAMVSCSSYIVDRTHFLGETRDSRHGFAAPSPYSSIPLIAKHRLWPEGVRQHHARLIRAILQAPFHYNLDFPTFVIKLADCSLQDADYITHLLEGVSAFRSLVDVSAPLSTESGLFRYSGLLKGQAWDWLKSKYITYRRYSKVRITWDSNSKVLLVTPIVQLAIDRDMRYENVAFSNREANGLWETLCGPHEQERTASTRALFRLLTAFAGIALGVSIIRDIVSVLEATFQIVSVDLAPDDMTLILDEHNSRALENMWSILRNESANIVNVSEDAMDAEQPVLSGTPTLREKIMKLWRRKPSLVPMQGELISECIGKVLLALRTVTDSPEIRLRQPSARRLAVGLTYADIRTMLEKCAGVHASDDEISLSIDFCVDQGLAVPKIIQGENLLFRAFYCGEDEDNQAPLQFKGAIHAAYTRFLKKRRAQCLTPFDFQKICVTMKNTMPWIPISNGPYTFGYTGMVGQEQLISWLTNGNSAPFSQEFEGDRTVMIPNGAYQCPVSPTWDSATQQRDFYDAFDYLATAFCKISNAAKLLLTTCRTHRHTFNAIAFEARTWIGYEDRSFGSFLLGLDKIVSGERSVNDEDLTSLYWSVRYISEGWKKYRIFFEQYAKYLKELGKGFSLQGPSGQRWWDYICQQNLFERNKDPEIETRFEAFLPLFEQMTSLTVFVVKSLMECGIVAEDAIESAFQKRGISLKFAEFQWLTSVDTLFAAKKYNRQIERGILSGRSIITDQLPVGETSVDNSLAVWTKERSEVVTGCFKQIDDAFRMFCPMYKTKDAEFPFSPNQYRRVLEDGSVEKPLRNLFILALDIIKGTHSEQTNDMKEQIRHVFRQFKSKGLVFQDTGDDAFVACADDVRVVWDAANVIRLRGEALKKPGEPFGGTRKGLYFGSIMIVEKPSGDALLHDRIRSNVIPASFSILPGIDEVVEEDQWNSVIIMPERVKERCAGKLHIDSVDLKKVSFKEKHFFGSCCVVDLK